MQPQLESLISGQLHPKSQKFPIRGSPWTAIEVLTFGQGNLAYGFYDGEQFPYQNPFLGPPLHTCSHVAH